MPKRVFFSLVSGLLPLFIQAQLLPGFAPSVSFGEQQMVVEDSPPGTRILINAPIEGFGNNEKVLLIFYALPNGSSIEHTFGKKPKKGDDFRFDIQHVGAQTRFLRNIMKERTIVVAYVEATQKSWPSWVAGTPDAIRKIKEMVDSVSEMFARWSPQVVMNGHSGGGRFILSYISAAEEIPASVVRIAFLDSSYGYEDTLHGPKITKWLKIPKKRYLCVLAYNDSVVIYNGKPLVSPTGGTWYRSKMMQQYLSESFRFKEKARDSLIWSRALGRRIEFILKPNPGGKIYHTAQVELNGYIHSILSGTRYEEKNYSYFGKRAYSEFISDSLILPIRRLNIPPRYPAAESGSDFIKRISSLPLNEREEEIYEAISSGNIPEFLRHTVTINGEFTDAEGKPIQTAYNGHVYWYVDYSHGIRFINNQVLVDGKTRLFIDILQDPVLYKIFSDENAPMNQVVYSQQ